MAALKVVEMVIMFPLLQPWLITQAAAQQKPQIAKPNCSDKCGKVDIPYPFGVEAGCYMNDWFKVTCNESVDADPKPFISSINLELLNVSISLGTVRVLNPVTTFNCSEKDDSAPFDIVLAGGHSPYFFSNKHNRFASVGCCKWTTIVHNQTNIEGCLLPKCSAEASISACHTTIPPVLTSFVAKLVDNNSGDDDNGDKCIRSCGSAFMIANDLLNPDGSVPLKIRNQTHVPAVLQWSIPIHGICNWKQGSNSFCDGHDNHCWANLSSTHFCVCSKSYEDDTVLEDCQALGKCWDQEHKYCQMLCLSTPGRFNCSWSCPDGYESSFADACYPKDFKETFDKKSAVKRIIIGCSAAIGTSVLLIGAWWSYKIANRRKIMKLKEKNFKNNGGLLLKQRLSSDELIRTFTSEELESATDKYSENRILGQGGQGTVYKGMLADGSIVAIKKPKMLAIGKKLNEKKLLEFINEKTILSQINHRNVVKLLGCCFETEVPLLVYEFIINGTLSQHIHEEENEELFPVRWEMRLRIASEVANALAYMHSSASAPIYHRDIKSSNILLDDKYRAKVSDFGISRLIESEQTHLTTQVQGTFGYLDPEYFQSNHFTAKSDVYSFGVVIVELLTGKKPLIISSQTEEVRSLASYFLLSMEKNSLSDILDQCVMKDGSQEEIIAVAKLAKRCLHLSGKERPTMKEVAMALELIKVSREAHVTQNDQGEESEDTIKTPAVAYEHSSITWSLEARP